MGHRVLSYTFNSNQPGWWKLNSLDFFLFFCWILRLRDRHFSVVRDENFLPKCPWSQPRQTQMSLVPDHASVNDSWIEQFFFSIGVVFDSETQWMLGVRWSSTIWTAFLLQAWSHVMCLLACWYYPSRRFTWEKSINILLKRCHLVSRWFSKMSSSSVADSPP